MISNSIVFSFIKGCENQAYPFYPRLGNMGIGTLAWFSVGNKDHKNHKNQRDHRNYGNNCEENTLIAMYK